MAERERTQLNPADLVEVYPDRQAGISWPLPVDAKLEHLLAEAKSAGERTSRREIAAAIVASTALTGQEVRTLLSWYRLARVSDLLPVPEQENVITFVPQGPGPRRRTG